MNDQLAYFHPGLGQGFAAAVAAATVTATVSISSWDDPIAPRLAIVSFVVFLLALLVGSSRVVGLSSFGVLGAALIGSTIAENPTWVESIVIGCVWYIAVELAWDSIERRDGAFRSAAYNLRRIQEVSTVVVVCVAAAWIAFIATAVGPSRTLAGLGLFLFLAMAGLAYAVAHVGATNPNSAEEP